MPFQEWLYCQMVNNQHEKHHTSRRQTQKPPDSVTERADLMQRASLALLAPD
jgi:hypothetical protein